MKHIGFLKDGRKVYSSEKGTLFAKTRIPYTLVGPTPTEIKQFEEEHSSAEPCLKCGYKFYVSIYGIQLAYDEGYCHVCKEDTSLTLLKSFMNHFYQFEEVKK